MSPTPIGLLHEQHWMSSLGALFADFRRGFHNFSSVWMVYLLAQVRARSGSVAASCKVACSVQSCVKIFMARTGLAQSVAGASFSILMILAFAFGQPYSKVALFLL